MIKGLNFYRTMYDQVNIFNGDYANVEQTANVDESLNFGVDESEEDVSEIVDSERKIFLNINKSISQELSIVLIGILAIQMAILISK